MGCDFSFLYDLSFRRMVAASFVELVGTFFYALVFAMAAATFINPTYVYWALVVGIFVGVLTYIGLGLSGGHYNPAITIGVALDDPHFSWQRLIYYVVAQFIGAILGGLVAASMGFDWQPAPGFDSPKVLLLEAIFSFLLVLVALRTTYKRDAYGFYVGAILVVAGALSLEGSGGVFNPAVATGLIIGKASVTDLDTVHASKVWIYFIAPIMGALFACLFLGILTFLRDGDNNDNDSTSEDSYKPVKPDYKPVDPYKAKPVQPYGQPQPKPTPYGNQPQPAYGAQVVQQPSGYGQQGSGYVVRGSGGY